MKRIQTACAVKRLPKGFKTIRQRQDIRVQIGVMKLTAGPDPKACGDGFELFIAFVTDRFLGEVVEVSILVLQRWLFPEILPC